MEGKIEGKTEREAGEEEIEEGRGVTGRERERDR